MRAVNKFENEAGVSLSGLLAVLVVLGVLALVAIKVTPALIEYRAVKGAIVKAKTNGGTVREMQQSFDHNAEVNNVSSIHGRDLVISRETGEPEISFAYEKRVPLIGNVSLLFDFEGTTDPGGTVAAKGDTAAR